MPVPDPLVMPLAIELRDCLAQEIAKVASPPRWVQIRPGVEVDHLISTTEDECCSGLAWVRPDVHFPSSTTFPVQDETPARGASGGASGWAVTLELGAIRCAPTPDAGRIPTEAEWLAVTQAVMDDAAAMRRAVCCFIAADPKRKGLVLPGAWRPIQVLGGCTGGTLTVVVRGPACDCQDAGPES